MNFFITVMALHDPQLHMGEALHMFRMVLGDDRLA